MEALHLWNWLEHQSTVLVVKHLAGSLNVRADDHEWGEPCLDLFATAENVQCQHFCALEFPKRLSDRAAFRLEWNLGLLYTFPAIPPAASSQEDQDRPGTSNSCSSGLGTEGMVSRTPGHEHQSSVQAAFPGGLCRSSRGGFCTRSTFMREIEQRQ